VAQIWARIWARIWVQSVAQIEVPPEAAVVVAQHAVQVVFAVSAPPRLRVHASCLYRRLQAATVAPCESASAGPKVPGDLRFRKAEAQSWTARVDSAGFHPVVGGVARICDSVQAEPVGSPPARLAPLPRVHSPPARYRQVRCLPVRCLSLRVFAKFEWVAWGEALCRVECESDGDLHPVLHPVRGS
jgi:hypothetical protein